MAAPVDVFKFPLTDGQKSRLDFIVRFLMLERISKTQILKRIKLNHKIKSEVMDYIFGYVMQHHHEFYLKYAREFVASGDENAAEDWLDTYLSSAGKKYRRVLGAENGRHIRKKQTGGFSGSSSRPPYVGGSTSLSPHVGGSTSLSPYVGGSTVPGGTTDSSEHLWSGNIKLEVENGLIAMVMAEALEAMDIDPPDAGRSARDGMNSLRRKRQRGKQD